MYITYAHIIHIILLYVILHYMYLVIRFLPILGWPEPLYLVKDSLKFTILLSQYSKFLDYRLVLPPHVFYATSNFLMVQISMNYFLLFLCRKVIFMSVLDPQLLG